MILYESATNKTKLFTKFLIIFFLDFLPLFTRLFVIQTGLYPIQVYPNYYIMKSTITNQNLWSFTEFTLVLSFIANF